MFICLFVCLCICVSVPKDPANRWTDQVLLNRVASHRSREGLWLFWGKTTSLMPLEKNMILPPKKFFLNLR